MRIGLALPHYDFSYPDRDRADARATVAWAQRAEQLGFDSVWISDHFFLDLARYGAPAGRQGAVEPFVTLAAVAWATTRVRLGTLVACAAFRSPAMLAKQSSTLSQLAQGRFDLGLGAGWFEDEYVANGIAFEPPAVRVARLSETLAIVRPLLAGENVVFEGEHYRVDDAEVLPVADPPPRIVIGSKGGPATLRLAARHADAWNTAWKIDDTDYAAKTALLDQECERAGRDPRSVGRSVGLYTVLGRDPHAVWEQLRTRVPPGVADAAWEEFAPGALTGTPQECVDRVGELAALGVEEIIVSPGPLPFAIPLLELLEEIAEVLIPAARTAS